MLNPGRGQNTVVALEVVAPIEAPVTGHWSRVLRVTLAEMDLVREGKIRRSIVRQSQMLQTAIQMKIYGTMKEEVITMTGRYKLAAVAAAAAMMDWKKRPV